MIFMRRLNDFKNLVKLINQMKCVGIHKRFYHNSLNKHNNTFPIIFSSFNHYVSKGLISRPISSGIIINKESKSVPNIYDESPLKNGKVPLQNIKKRQLRKKMRKLEKSLPLRNITAFCTADEYSLEEVSDAIKVQGLYQRIELPDDVEDVIHVKAKYEVDNETREIYFFREGSVVFWNVPSVERESVLAFIQPFQVNRYDPEIVYEEMEEMDYDYTNNGKTRLQNDTILIHSEVNDPHLIKYAYSNAIALSVKLAILEASLDRYIDSIEYVTRDMKQGKKVKLTRDEVFRKTGKLFALRHQINLSSDLLDTPDFYWDREELEKMFVNMYYFLNINKRTKIMNEKLSNCVELMELLKDHLNDIHHVRLEWMIIILIMVEVLFECIHYADRLF